MRYAREIIFERNKKLEKAINILKDKMSHDTIKYCEEVLNKKFEENFSNIEKECYVFDCCFYCYKQYGISYYIGNYQGYEYYIDKELLTSYLSKYGYTVTYVQMSNKLFYFCFKVDPQCLAN